MMEMRKKSKTRCLSKIISKNPSKEKMKKGNYHVYQARNSTLRMLLAVHIQTRSSMLKVCVIIVITLMVALSWHPNVPIKTVLCTLNLCAFLAIRREKEPSRSRKLQEFAGQNNSKPKRILTLNAQKWKQKSRKTMQKLIMLTGMRKVSWNS